MSQHDLDIANQGFPATRADINNALQALGSSNSGATAPSTTYANQLWYDTANNIIKIRNEDNDAWISLFTLDQTNDNIEALTVNGTITADALTVDTDTLHVDASADVVRVGKTSGGVTTDGWQLSAGASHYAIPSGQYLILNRTTSGAATMIDFRSENSSKGAITYNGTNVSFTSGSNNIFNQSGISFDNGTNYLDDYEEGDWTPANASIASITFSSATGKYVKIGSFVLATGFVTYPSTSDSNHAKIGGLPFAITSNGHSSATISFKSTSNLATMNPAQSTSEMNLHTESGGTTTNANMSNATVYFAAMYRNA